MTSFAARFAGVATLALAALPIAALATAASAAPAAVKVRDLDLNSASGKAAFHQRADAAAHAYCKGETRPGSRLLATSTCEDGVKAELSEKLAVAQAVQRQHRGIVASR
jgi:UrcA family protein